MVKRIQRITIMNIDKKRRWLLASLTTARESLTLIECPVLFGITKIVIITNRNNYWSR